MTEKGEVCRAKRMEMSASSAPQCSSFCLGLSGPKLDPYLEATEGPLGLVLLAPSPPYIPLPTGSGFVMCSGKENPDSDADLDVDGDDTLEYGKPQYPWGTVGPGGAGGTSQGE